MYTILLTDGELVDPPQGIHSVESVVIQNSKIAAVGKDISKVRAEKVFNMIVKNYNTGTNRHPLPPSCCVRKFWGFSR
jgi:hypothetical protein